MNKYNTNKTAKKNTAFRKDINSAFLFVQGSSINTFFNVKNSLLRITFLNCARRRI